MALDFLKITGARNLTELSLEPNNFLNIIHGKNGSGKTTILESIYLLLRARTFRSAQYRNFINSDSIEVIVFTKFNQHQNNQSSYFAPFTLGIKRSKANPLPVYHLNQKKISSISEISRLVILGLITPDSFSLLDSGPSSRRKYIDWGVFHVEHQFVKDWRDFKKILIIRNSLLKDINKQRYKIKDNKTEKLLMNNLNSWTPQFIELNNRLTNYRKKQIEIIRPFFFNFLKNFSNDLHANIKLNFYKGWSKEQTFKDYLFSHLDEDIKYSTTRFSTHRCELKINYKNYAAKDILSRGQKKIVIICLILAQISYLKEKTDINNFILLLDDIDSELDETNLNLLFKILNEIRAQTFITTTDRNNFQNFTTADSDIKYFEIHD
jgi:DNA replication and repair protein RecF